MFNIANPEDIKAGKVTDIYFERAINVLRAKGINKYVKVEFVVKKFPGNYQWGVFAGLDEVLTLLEGLPVTVKAMPEGTVFRANEPVMTIEGMYLDFAVYETAILGLICQASGIATKSARCKLAAGDKIVVHFGARRMHPAITPMIDRSSYIGGCDGVATPIGAELLGIQASGTMPHALILLFGDTLEAVKAFDEIIDPKVPRIALIDTFADEKFEAVRIAEALGNKLYGVRLDTPSSRRGNFLAILKEVRWELDIRGFENVKIFVSGGIDEEIIKQLNEVVDAYGVGTTISSAPVLDFAMDIVEIEGRPIAKRGKLSGEKQVYVNEKTGERIVLPANKKFNDEEFKPLLEKVIENGKILKPPKKPSEIREYVLRQIKNLTL
ncbi:nicotinate phosphoribosyltransferase [Candidatus Kryptobacter tengchongensis]|uniref:nicotinate phosphoribosyltransferase n=1 Tax=Kryptobacter tengchongensis TaxID=1643429 RepID=A0A656DFP4_KRYT1|nr:nicotinate phosphoribosyltransferase [Candidatus Kryptobacter tengchongensis]CUS80991.1 nicotinate phosphoribosyltransferase [Candidatus Kryptobacter tengchongensis]CUT00044.1 nicotinate phosphoribosyltransferase [Candidatus Kryptobacter tengchongensis]CUT04966.1 nicotinate phosphoribosyltransferase [Candidatus Kryptobacter tengchongensis]CUU09831.1 nicotinate phosphoribosyltransferase [Candidatus Kryptobacter tengchongensis]CUU10306.1 nicotinate phosphoribosyltransferase [Candidatus Krypto